MRCAWAENEIMRAYHDEEWGVARHREHELFELLTLEGAQAGLSWATILQRRDGYRRVFSEFDPLLVAAYDEADVQRLLQDEGVIRHRGKIESTITNARAMLRLRDEGPSLDELLWSFVGGSPHLHDWARYPDVPAMTPASTAMSKDLKRRGFRFVGPTTCYAFMQAAGLVNDHHPSCFRYAELRDDHS